MKIVNRTLENAILSNNAKLVRNILNSGVDPNRCNALCLACKKGHMKIVEILITNKHRPADPNIRDSRGSLPISYAMDNGEDMVRLMLKDALVKVDVNLLDPWRDPLLYRAVLLRSMPLLQLLFGLGADVNVPQTRKHGKMDYCIIHAAVKTSPIEVIKYLVEERGAEIPTKNGSILLSAIELRRTSCLDYFLHRGFKKHGDKVWWHESLLHTAVETIGSEECAVVLLRWGVYNVPCRNNPYDAAGQDIPNVSIFKQAALLLQKKFMMLMTQLYPQCLQEQWLVENDMPYYYKDYPLWQSYIAQLRKERKHPPPLFSLCRTKIIQLLGYNHIHKARETATPQGPQTLRSVQGCYRLVIDCENCHHSAINMLFEMLNKWQV